MVSAFLARTFKELVVVVERKKLTAKELDALIMRKIGIFAYISRFVLMMFVPVMVLVPAYIVFSLFLKLGGIIDCSQFWAGVGLSLLIVAAEFMLCIITQYEVAIVGAEPCAGNYVCVKLRLEAPIIRYRHIYVEMTQHDIVCCVKYGVITDPYEILT